MAKSASRIALNLARRLRKADGGSTDDTSLPLVPEAEFVNPLADQFARGFVNTLAAPGNAYQSTQPVTTEQMIKPAADLAGLTTLGAGAMPAEADALRMGIKAYHGSPHDFDAFSLDKIGTGEGAQAYGHGLYFADNEGVAKSYRDALASAANNSNPAYRRAQDWLEQWSSPHQARSELDNWIADFKAQGRPDMAADYEAMIPHLDNPNPGRMYEVNINADPEQFLDWDKPLSEQPQAVQALANEHQMPFVADRGFDLTGGNLYSHLANKLGGERPLAGGSYTVPFKNDPGAASALRSAGIPGIKYLDQGSRAAGKGSRNYVVFDDKLIDILRKYGLAGIPAAGSLAVSQQGDEHMKRGGAARRALKVAKANGGTVFEGYIPGATGGRTDNKDISVQSGAYVLPADILSGLGEGNSHAGWASIAKHYGLDKPRKADGGEAVPIVAASGEAVIPPDAIIAKHGSLDAGHKVLDALVKHIRAKTIKKLKSLPGPKRD